MFSDGPKACSMCEITPYGPVFQSLLSAFLSLAKNRMSTTQKVILQCCVSILRFREVTLTALADLVSRKTGVPYSTVKWNIRSLVAIGFLVGGNADSKGELASFTEVAAMLVENLEEIGIK